MSGLFINGGEQSGNVHNRVKKKQMTSSQEIDEDQDLLSESEEQSGKYFHKVTINQLTFYQGLTVNQLAFLSEVYGKFAGLLS